MRCAALLGAIPTLLVIITLTFFMMRLAPGGPFDSQRRLPPEIEHNVEAAYNLDKPVYQQYFLYLDRLAHGDLGPSLKIKDFTVTQLIAAGLPVSAKLGLSAMVLALLFGITLGVTAALNQNRLTDHSIMSIAMFGITIPNFVTAPLLTLVFGVYGLHLFGIDLPLPVAGWNGGALRNMILPVIVLALPQIADHRAAGARQHGRGAALQLCAHGARQGPAGPCHRDAPCASRRAVAARQLSRAGHRAARHRLADRRTDFRPAGHRPLFRAGRAESRLHAGDGRGDLLRDVHHRC